jgi:hypothetical protein
LRPQTPPGDTAVDEADALRAQLLAVGLVVGPAGVAAVDHEVALGEEVPELGDHAVGPVAGGDHHPDDLG